MCRSWRRRQSLAWVCLLLVDGYIDLGASTEGNVGDVDGNGDGFARRGSVWIRDIHTASGRDHDAVEFPVLGGVVHRRSRTQDVHGVVETTKQGRVVEVVGLLARVRQEAVRVGHPQAPPHLTSLTPRLDLGGNEVGAS